VEFVEEVREINKEEGMSPELAMEKAIENCIKKGILTKFLNLHKAAISFLAYKYRGNSLRHPHPPPFPKKILQNTIAPLREILEVV